MSKRDRHKEKLRKHGEMRAPVDSQARPKYPAPPSLWATALERVNKDGTPDGLRREVLAEFAKHTGRSLVVYATAFHVPGKAMLGNAQLLSLVLSDISGFREVIRDIPGEKLDLVLHTPGGSAEAAEGVVGLLRSRFKDLRVLVPLAAKSAGTMMAMAANSVIALAGAELGPIDPQFVVQGRFAPAKAIENQFERARKEIVAEPRGIPAWVPLLSSLGPSLLEECRKALELSRGLVVRWLAEYMFAGEPRAEELAIAVANTSRTTSTTCRTAGGSGWRILGNLAYISRMRLTPTRSWTSSCRVFG